MSDPQKYRSKEEVNEYKEKDPLAQVQSVIMEQGWMTEKDVEKLEAKVKAQVNNSVEFAENSPLPELDELYKDVYTQEDYPYIMD